MFQKNVVGPTLGPRSNPSTKLAGSWWLSPTSCWLPAWHTLQPWKWRSYIPRKCWWTFNWATLCYKPENWTLPSHICENLKYSMLQLLCCRLPRSMLCFHSVCHCRAWSDMGALTFLWPFYMRETRRRGDRPLAGARGGLWPPAQTQS